jgi:hypothetical protein
MMWRQSVAFGEFKAAAGLLFLRCAMPGRASWPTQRQGWLRHAADCLVDETRVFWSETKVLLRNAGKHWASSGCMTGQTWMQRAIAGTRRGKTWEHSSNAGVSCRETWLHACNAWEQWPNAWLYSGNARLFRRFAGGSLLMARSRAGSSAAQPPAGSECISSSRTPFASRRASTRVRIWFHRGSGACMPFNSTIGALSWVVRRRIVPNPSIRSENDWVKCESLMRYSST